MPRRFSRLTCLWKSKWVGDPDYKNPTCNSSCSQSQNNHAACHAYEGALACHFYSPSTFSCFIPIFLLCNQLLLSPWWFILKCNFQLVSPWWVVQKCKDAYRGQFAWCSFKWLGKCTAGIFNHNFSTSTLACHSQFCISMMTDWRKWPVKISS